MSINLENCGCPETVPIIEADDVYKGNLYGPNYTSCLLGWKNRTFGTLNTCSAKADLLLRKEILRTCKKNRRFKGWDDWAQVSIPTFNDSSKTKKSTLARVWNRVMAKMGYVVGNPEAGKVS